MIACFHIADYPMWVCRQLHPGRPALVLHDGLRVVATSDELRARGLEPGESIERARELFPDAEAYERDLGAEEAMWEDLLHLLHDLSPRLLTLRPGTALLEPWDAPGLRQIARSLSGRVGLARRRFVAMLAAYMAPDKGISEASPELVNRLYNRSPVAMLAQFGFDPEMIERFELFGLGFIDRLLELGRRHLEAQFGAEGRRLFELLHPPEDEPGIPEFTPPPSVTVHHDLDYPAAEPGELLPILDLVIDQARTELAGRRTQLLTLRLTGGRRSGPRTARRLLKEPTSRRLPLFVTAERMLASMLGELEIERMTVELGALTQPVPEQGGLFTGRPAVYEAVRAIHNRYPGALLRAVIEDPDPLRPEEGIRYESYPDSAPARSGRRRGR